MDARPLLINAHHRAGALLAWSAPAATSPWAARVRDATHAWLRQTARLADPDAAPAPPWQAACDAAAALRDLVEAGQLRSIVDEVLPMERAAEAHRRVEAETRLGALVLSLG